MEIVVLKFGGTSVGSINRIKKVAKIINQHVKRKKKSDSCFVSNERCDK